MIFNERQKVTGKVNIYIILFKESKIAKRGNKKFAPSSRQIDEANERKNKTKNVMQENKPTPSIVNPSNC